LSTPPFWLRAKISAICSMVEKIMKLQESLTRLALNGRSPTMNSRWPSASSTGLTRSMSAASPAAMTKSLPASAAGGRPRTGAVMYP
jgi:hypothetical protein